MHTSMLRRKTHNVFNKSFQLNEDSLLCMSDLLSFSWQVADGMVVTEFYFKVSNTQAYLASKSCVHRDVAARNVMINARKMAKVIEISLK